MRNDFGWKMLEEEYGGMRGLAAFLGVSGQRVYAARAKGQFPPQWARKIHLNTNGRIRADLLVPEVFSGLVA